MNRTQARFRTILGAMGLLTLSNLRVVAVAPGYFGSGQRLVLANCGPTIVHGTVVHVASSDRDGAMIGGGN